MTDLPDPARPRLTGTGETGAELERLYRCESKLAAAVKRLEEIHGYASPAVVSQSRDIDSLRMCLVLVVEAARNGIAEASK